MKFGRCFHQLKRSFSKYRALKLPQLEHKLDLYSSSLYPFPPSSTPELTSSQDSKSHVSDIEVEDLPFYLDSPENLVQGARIGQIKSKFDKKIENEKYRYLSTFQPEPKSIVYDKQSVRHVPLERCDK